MASGCFVIASDNAFNRAVLKDCGNYYAPDKASLYSEMERSLKNEARLDQYRIKAQNRIIKHYNWQNVASQYERLLYNVYRGEHPWYHNLVSFRFNILYSK